MGERLGIEGEGAETSKSDFTGVCFFFYSIFPPSFGMFICSYHPYILYIQSEV